MTSRSASAPSSWRPWSPASRSDAPALREDAANAVYLFCIPESDYITGQVVVAGGGLVL